MSLIKPTTLLFAFVLAVFGLQNCLGLECNPDNIYNCLGDDTIRLGDCTGVIACLNDMDDCSDPRLQVFVDKEIDRATEYPYSCT